MPVELIKRHPQRADRPLEHRGERHIERKSLGLEQLTGPNHPLTQHLRWERENMKKREDLADFFFFDWD